MIDRILDLKIKHKSLYILKFDDESSALFHAISWGEFKAIRDIMASYPNMEHDIKEYLFHKCLLEYIGPGGIYKKDIESTDGLFEMIPAGVVYSIADAILKISGPLDINQLFNRLEVSRQYSEIAAEERILALVSSINNYTNSDLDDMEWNKIADLITQSELIMSKQLPEVPFRLSLPEENTGIIDFKKENKEMI